ncbi:Phosphoribosylformylglycinamidine synthase [Escherichia coli]|uniref:Phosphoribosylformylglycinamidine synthase n=1 Tax=Escherichia coli TaxID=562 RepID=A0A376W8Z8_ECOLX|nr:Phosphoribosylformylglycinamidine synthase [Escherichia coli]
MPELVSDGGRGGKFELRDILSDEPGMSPLEIWCNESQERYVLAVAADQLPLFDELCKRERAPYAVIGEATEELHLSLHDRHFDNQPIDLPLDVLLGKTPKMTRDVQTLKAKGDALAREGITIADAVKRVLHLPTVAEKTFLVTIGDRSVTGMVARDQMVGRGRCRSLTARSLPPASTATMAKRWQLANVRQLRCWISPLLPVWQSVKR